MKVTYHAQLFDTIQLDVYGSYMLLPDRHVGRAEIRLIQLDGMPETFTSFYEIWDKKLSSGGSSHAVRKATMSTNVGALQAKITYQFQTINSAFDHDNDPNGIPTFGNSNDGSPDAIAFKRHLQRDRDASSIHFRKYEEGAQDNNSNNHDDPQQQRQQSDSDSSLHPPSPLENEDFPDDSDSDDNATKYSSSLSFSVKRANSIKSGTPSAQTTTLPPPQQLHPQTSKTTMLDSVGYWFGVNPSQSTPASSQPSMHDAPATLPANRTLQTKSTSVDILNDMNDSLKTYPLLDTIGSWTVSKETNQILRAIGKLLAAFVSLSLQ
jgi:hypothetical protein